MTASPLPPPLAGDGSDAPLRRVLREFLTGLTVVSASVDGVPHAMTASAFSAVSLDPPLVLVCVARQARFHQAIVAAGRWGVSILGADQAAVAQRFATSGRDLDRQFDGVDHVRGRHTDAALLSGALAWLECETRHIHPAGDHSIVVAEVLGARVGDDPNGDDDTRPRSPLAYHRGRYA